MTCWCVMYVFAQLVRFFSKSKKMTDETAALDDSMEVPEEEEATNVETKDDAGKDKDTPKGTTTILPKREHFGSDKKKLCSFGGCVCTQRPMRGYDFCVKHILQDTSAPFKQCDFISKQTDKRCGNPVPTNQEDTRYCNAHKQMLGLMPRGSAGYSRKKRKGSPSKETSDVASDKKKKAKKKASTQAGLETDADDDALIVRKRRKMDD